MLYEKERFSVLQLERDVIEYCKYRDKYNFYNYRMNTIGNWFFLSTYYKKKVDKYYNLYIYSLSRLEKKYRHINIYTNYHQNLEYPEEKVDNFVYAESITYAEPTAPNKSYIFD